MHFTPPRKIAPRHSQPARRGIYSNGSPAELKMTKIAAFTLVEMSIVLIIVGLIIGGVTAGSSLIRGAKVANIVTEYTKHSVAINTFHMKYDALPGDMKNAYDYWGVAVGCTDSQGSSASCNGDGDGYIDLNWESPRAWQQLSSAGLIEGQYSGVVSPKSSVPGVNIPQSGLEDNIGWALFKNTNVATAATDGKNRFIFGKVRVDNGVNWVAALSPVEAQSIDKKIDNGMPQTGKVWARNGMGVGNCVTALVPSATYDLSHENIRCVMTFDLGL